MTPYRILVVVQVTAALLAGVFAMLPVSAGQLRVADTTISVALLVFSAVVYLVLPHLSRGHGPHDLGLDVAIAIDILIAGFAVAYVPLEDGQFEVGIGLIIFGIFAAYFRPRPLFLAHLTLISVVWAAGALWVNPQLPNAVDVMVVLASIVGIALMVSRMAERLRAQALYDSLTGTLNRRGLDLMSAPLAAAGARTGTPIALAMIDLDGFKAYNDRFGHLAGDRLLVDLTEAWRGELRLSDLVARYGGDEFALVLPRTTEAEAHELVSRLRAAHPAPWSVGFGIWHEGMDLYEALSRADHVLYVAKRARRAIPEQLDSRSESEPGPG